MAFLSKITPSRTSYNEKEEIRAYTIGVLKYNNTIRNEILQRNIGKYKLYTEELSPAIGESYDVYNREFTKYFNLDENGLLGYTIKDTSKLGNILNKQYGRNESDLAVYGLINPNPSQVFKWGGKYENYIKYISSTYGHEIKFNELLLDLLGENDIKYAMHNNRVGVTRNINVAYSLAGVMITNINNYSGKDTQLGTITNKMYALTLNNAAYFNTLRNTKYITPRLVSEYGNNISNINKLSDLFPISDETGRLSYDIGYGDFIGDETQVEPSEHYYNNINNNSYILTNDGITVYRYTPSLPYVRNSLLNNKIILTNDTVNKSLSKNNYGNNVYGVYSEGDNNGENNKDLIQNVNNNTYKSFEYNDNALRNNLLDKTNELFNNRKIGTLIGRFHSTSDTDISDKETSITQTSVSNYGISHGRNLLKKGRNGTKWASDDVNGYDNPYCRVWTYHHQYNTIKNLIRPFTVKGSNGQDKVYSINDLQTDQVFSRHDSGAKHLSDNTVLDNNGFVNITPTNDGVSIKKCMFSIENLAWKDVLKTEDNISSEQIGPLGGRIMWFPPYNIKFTENSNVSWNGNDFIGRGEKIYTYVNTERSGTLSFSLLIDHPSIIDYWKGGKALDKENEDDLLRFFAGCDILDLTDKITDETVYNEEESLSNEPKIDIPDGKSVIFYVYFPNNYSGKDDLPYNNDSLVNSLLYLFCGRGTQKNDLVEVNDEILNDFANYPGYEMNNNLGITVDSNPENTGDIIKGKNGNWAYRIDSDYIDELLREKGNYYDRNSYSLNSKLDLQPQDATNTFAEIFTAIQTNSSNINAIKNRSISYGANEDRINELVSLFNSNNYKISQININGSASSHGTVTNNNKLNRDRANTLKYWLTNSLPSKLIEKTMWTNNNNDIQLTKSDSQSDLSAKLGRSARVEITFQGGKVDSLSDINPSATNNDLNLNGNTFNEIINNNIEDENNINQTQISPKILRKKSSVYNKHGRYENEGEFFTRISIDEPLMKEKIINKIKYFDPAFHSISPEGFNSRLTFLQQCTRQGHTIDAADKNGYVSETAGNLAFGRPPICVLRVGDFYYTRIVIESLNIDYDPLTWDMNPEGIGMQPMIANINISFKFIGGGDLGGPISRLQNAVSFNYYANTSVYDDRADRIIYENNESEGTKGTFTNIWIPENSSNNK